MGDTDSNATATHDGAQRVPPQSPLRVRPGQVPSPRRGSEPVHHPVSDGKPMAETGTRWHATVDATTPLINFFMHRPDVYVGGDMLMYYREGDPSAVVSPDVFVALGAPKEPLRDTWKLWEGAQLRLFDPAQDACLLTHEEDFSARIRAKEAQRLAEAERDQEARWRQAAEAMVAELKRATSREVTNWQEGS